MFIFSSNIFHTILPDLNSSLSFCAARENLRRTAFLLLYIKVGIYPNYHYNLWKVKVELLLHYMLIRVNPTMIISDTDYALHLMLEEFNVSSL